MTRRAWPLLYILLLTGCQPNKERMPFYGRWGGGFVVDAIAGGGTEKDRQRSTLNGYLMLYATGNSFLMHEEGEQEILDIKGTWRLLKPTRVELEIAEIKIDDMGGEDKRDPNRKFIPTDDVRAAYSRPLVLDISPDKQSLTGLRLAMGDLTGRHVYKR